MKLDKQQEKAIEMFNKFGYLVLEGQRQSGKTTVLKEIARRNPDKKIGVICSSGAAFETLYKHISNCEDARGVISEGRRYDILLGDEVLIEPRVGTKTACVETRRYVVTRLKSLLSKKYLDDLKKRMDEHEFLIQFGQE